MLLLRLIGSFLIACLLLSLISFVIVQYQILPIQEQIQLKKNKTYWDWITPHNNHTASIHYIEKGSGPHHVLFLHGFRSNTYTWKHLLDPLERAGFHVWALDLIGYGFSDKPDTEYNLDLFIHQIEDFMKDKGILSAHLIGSSMGGGLALSMAVYYPHRVNSLTLIGALGYPLDLPLYISIGRHLSQLWSPFLGPTMIRKNLEQIVYQKETISDEQVYAYSLPYWFPGGASAALSTLKNFDNSRLVSLSECYSEINRPVLIIWGAHDKLIPIEHYEHFCQDFPHAHKILLKECGHIPQEEKPAETREAIIAFLKQIQEKN